MTDGATKGHHLLEVLKVIPGVVAVLVTILTLAYNRGAQDSDNKVVKKAVETGSAQQELRYRELKDTLEKHISDEGARSVLTRSDLNAVLIKLHVTRPNHPRPPARSPDDSPLPPTP